MRTTCPNVKRCSSYCDAFRKKQNPLLLVIAQARHFLPVLGVCEGSPSRAQYIAGQPRDSRYPYEQKKEKEWREAYREAQEEYAKYTPHL